jgi:hypothetical protein
MTRPDTRTRLAIHLLHDLGITQPAHDNPQAIWDRMHPLDRDHYLRRADAILAVIADQPPTTPTTDTDPAPSTVTVELPGISR